MFKEHYCNSIDYVYYCYVLCSFNENTDRLSMSGNMVVLCRYTCSATKVSLHSKYYRLYYTSPLRVKSSRKLHNRFLINVVPMNIVAVACRLTGCRPRGNPMFRCAAVLLIIYDHSGRASGRKTWTGDKLNIRCLCSFLRFSPVKELASPNLDANGWEIWMTVDTNSLRYLLRRSSKNRGL